MFKLATPYHLNRSPFRRATGVLHMLARDETIRRRQPAVAMDIGRCSMSAKQVDLRRAVEHARHTTKTPASLPGFCSP